MMLMGPWFVLVVVAVIVVVWASQRREDDGDDVALRLLDRRLGSSGGGTALVAPAAVLVVVLFAAFLLLRDRPASMVGAVLLAAVALLNTIGALGETITWEAVAADTFDVIRAIPAWGSVIAGMFMWAFAIAELAGTRRVPTDRIQSSVERELAEHTS